MILQLEHITIRTKEVMNMNRWSKTSRFFRVLLVLCCWAVIAVLVEHYIVFIRRINQVLTDQQQPLARIRHLGSPHSHFHVRRIYNPGIHNGDVHDQFYYHSNHYVHESSATQELFTNLPETVDTWRTNQRLNGDGKDTKLEEGPKVFNRSGNLKYNITVNKPVTPSVKSILLWNDYQYYYDVKREPLFESCPVNSCVITTDRNQSAIVDAIIFNVAPRAFHQECQGVEKECEIPLLKPKHQIWVFHTLEPSCLTSMRKQDNKEMLFNSFNWTFTYKRNSDVFTPYGMIIKRDEPLTRNFSEIIKAKKKLVAWVVSDCTTRSRREEYVAELSKYINVDILGDCGRPCRNCWRYINVTYKFYLAFENNLADDYVSEKFFRSWNLDVVLVSRSGANYSIFGVLPEMHIDTSDFTTPKALAEYLLLLDRNDTLYLQYLNWKNYYRTTRPMDGPYVNWCSFCSKLHEEPQISNVYSKSELWDWLYGSGTLNGCRAPTDLDFNKTDTVTDREAELE
ncbi:galactoside 3(4)-L-fucosyltransferase [Lingula anatina]|uniref:Fucosyltransferase n=1 Tax=Lingula anatina TaxID=7574 RepID=A0A1S3JIX6_LINAN|nr:galactoside 3(4)-L-fucosyltransferase [Lingula anatina]|eukprot:XP_013410328.1 galactoside 3(4)-L-fucosyltransferase [Lingula anatina]